MHKPWRALIVTTILVTACDPAPTRAEPHGEFTITEVAAGRGDSVEVGRPDFVRSGPNGQLYIASQFLSGLVMVLDSNARLVRTIGGHGPGPGEFEAVAMLYPKADSVVIGDRRGSVMLFGPAGAYVRTLPVTITATSAVLRLRGDTLLVPEPAINKSGASVPMQLLAPGGDTTRLIGPEERSFARGAESRRYRIVAPSDDSTFWAAPLDRYRVERWHMNGKLLQSFDETRSWFPQLEQGWDGSNAKPYPTRVLQLHQDHDGHLFVLIERANPDFKPTGIQPARESGKSEPLTSRLRYLEQVIEVLYAATGELLETIGITGTYLLNFVDDGRLVGLRANADGGELPVIFTLSHGISR